MLGGDKRDGSIVMNGWFSCPGVRRGGTERAVWFIFWVSKERGFSNFLIQISSKNKILNLK